MSWLAENLLWILPLAGVFFLMRRNGMGARRAHERDEESRDGSGTDAGQAILPAQGEPAGRHSGHGGGCC